MNKYSRSQEFKEPESLAKKTHEAQLLARALTIYTEECHFGKTLASTIFNKNFAAAGQGLMVSPAWRVSLAKAPGDIHLAGPRQTPGKMQRVKRELLTWNLSLTANNNSRKSTRKKTTS